MDKQLLIDFINNNISTFHTSRLDCLSKLKLEKILKRKNPYLFKAKNIHSCNELVKMLLDAHLSSNEETLFGDFLEKLAIYVCSQTRGGFKSGITGIDLEINESNNRYIISIKSGPNWGNSTQISKMKDNFKTAAKVLRGQQSDLNVIAINGCCYGRDNKPDKGEYYKYCGQRFWHFITGDDDFYLDIIEPLGYKAKQKNDDFYKQYYSVLNIFTKNFTELYCLQDGQIDWEKIVKLNSQTK